jgi:hypothetical protein
LRPTSVRPRIGSIRTSSRQLLASCPALDVASQRRQPDLGSPTIDGQQVDRTLEGDLTVFDGVRRREYGELRRITRALSNAVDHVCQVARVSLAAPNRHGMVDCASERRMKTSRYLSAEARKPCSAAPSASIRRINSARSSSSILAS